MLITRKLLVNSRNNQKSITLPSKVLKDMELKSGKPVRTIHINILSPSEVRDIKLANRK